MTSRIQLWYVDSVADVLEIASVFHLRCHVQEQKIQCQTKCLPEVSEVMKNPTLLRLASALIWKRVLRRSSEAPAGKTLIQSLSCIDPS